MTTENALFPEPEREIPAEVLARWAPPDLDVPDWTSDHLVAFIEGMLIKREMQAVVHALHRLAVVDPHRAQSVLDAFDLAHALRDAS